MSHQTNERERERNDLKEDEDVILNGIKIRK